MSMGLGGVAVEGTQDIDGIGWGSYGGDLGCRWAWVLELQSGPGCRWSWVGGEAQSCEAQAAYHRCAALSCFRQSFRGSR